MNQKLLTLASLLVAAILGYLLIQNSAERRRIDAQLAATRASAEKLQAELKDLKAAQIADADLARLKADQRDAIKLRGEISNLKHTLATAQKAAENAQKLAAAAASKTPRMTAAELITAPLPEDNPDVRVFKTGHLAANFPVGNTLVVGGWQTPDGKRLFALVRPARIDGAGNLLRPDQQTPPGAADQVTVQTKWIQMPADVADNSRLGKYLDKNGQQSAIFEGNAFEEFAKQAEVAPNVDILTPPTVTTLAGRQARVSVTESHATGKGPVDFGPQIDIIPTLSEDGSQFNITMQASMTDSKNPLAKPNQ